MRQAFRGVMLILLSRIGVDMKALSRAFHRILRFTERPNAGVYRSTERHFRRLGLAPFVEPIDQLGIERHIDDFAWSRCFHGLYVPFAGKFVNTSLRKYVLT